VVEDDFVLSNETFAEIEMPNEAAFFMDDRDTALNCPNSRKNPA
jgi:hypothetical protein